MITQAVGAVLRALCIVGLIFTPALLRPEAVDSPEILALIALFAAIFVFFEYNSYSPVLLEFRSAPPFNRVRFLALGSIIALLSLATSGSSTGAEVLFLAGTLVTRALSADISPLTLAAGIAPADQVSQVQAMVGIAYLLVLFWLAAFVLALRFAKWPKRASDFNIFINMPTFDPTCRGDIIDRVKRDARVNVAIGLILPFALPFLIKAFAGRFDMVSLDNEHLLIWIVAAWAFLPTSLIMRGIVLSRVAQMMLIARRERYEAFDGDPEKDDGLYYA